MEVIKMVKTFVVGTVNGVTSSFEKLDRHVNELGDIEIIDVNDTLYPGELEKNNIPMIARRVVYKINH